MYVTVVGISTVAVGPVTVNVASLPIVQLKGSDAIFLVQVKVRTYE